MAGIVGALAPMATKFLKDGGLDKLMSNFKDAGLADKADSWVGTGPNAELSAAEAAQVMPNATKELAAQAGISEDEAADVLSKVVPGLVDKVTPNGEVPSQEEISGALTKLGIA
jgi:uncharacterized protein YidB (DUF937 family)